MTSRSIIQVAEGKLPPASMEQPFRIVAESFMSPFISHDTHWIYFIQYGCSLNGGFEHDTKIPEATAKKLITLFNLEYHFDTYERMLFLPAKKNTNQSS